MAEPETWVRRRICLIGFCFVTAFCLIVARAFQLQVVDREEWRQRAERQHQRVVQLTPQRGTIFDQNGEELALSIEVDSIYVEPHRVKDSGAHARELAGILDLPVSSVRAKLNSKKHFLWLKRQVSPRQSAQVRELDLEGVDFIKEHKRFYPNSELAGQVLGFTGVDPKGLEGLELKYDSLILGQGGYLVTERDALGRSLGGSRDKVEGGQRGYDLYLTLDKNLQYIAEKELAAGIKAAEAKAGVALVIEPATGKVLAMASQPDYNPNAFSRYRPSQWRNRALCDTFEPGSTTKVFLMAAALHEGVVTERQKIDCEKGVFRVGGKVIHDHHPYSLLTPAEIIKFSSNIGTAKIGKALERERVYQYLSGFGFGRPTGIDLPGEASGVLRRPSSWFEVDLAAISFGQGMSVTPLQLARATAAIANDGVLMEADLVEKVVDSYGQVVEQRRPKVVRRVVSAGVARKVRDMMIQVTEDGGTGTLGAVPGFRVAGKTGTAQKVDPVTGGYSVDRRVASFVGFVPAEKPRLTILVVVDEPQGTPYGGLVAAPVFARIADQSLRHLNVTPTLPVSEPLPVVPVIARESASVVREVAAVAADAETSMLMPDCVGLSYRQMLRVMDQTGLNIKLMGSGRVVDQSPAPGAAINYNREVWVRMAPPS